ncbi:MAG TPA: hypothetical protein VK548_26585 [Candidatus Acidoferrum sp.]|nr:hypothetical protein [Candidatus Acidoferrum sp.]
MSSKNNVNKDFYTLAGRDRPNERLAEMATKHLPDELPGHRGSSRPNFIPGAPPVGEASPRDEPEAQTPAEQTGTKSGSQKQATAPRDGKAPGKPRPKSGDARRKPQETVANKRDTTPGDAARRSRRRAA